MSFKQDRARKKHRRAASKREHIGDRAHRTGNAISHAPRAEGAGAAGSRPRVAAAMPEEIRRRFTHKRDGYYFPDGKRAFLDRGHTLTTRSEYGDVIRSFAAIAKIRGWRAVTVTGSDRFRRRMWLAARLANIAVAGFTPDAELQAQLERKYARRVRHRAPPIAAPPVRTAPAIADPTARAPTPAPRPKAISSTAPREWRGRLIDHGEAPYQHQAGSAMSYFIKLQTLEGERDLWGIDLKRALRASFNRPASWEAVVIRRVASEEVTLRAGASDGQSVRGGEPPRRAHRYRYLIETSDFLARRADAARLVLDGAVSAQAATRQMPELVGTYLQLRAAELIAQRLIHVQDRRHFVQLVRRAMAGAIGRGEPLHAFPVRARTSARELDRQRPPRAAEPLRE